MVDYLIEKFPSKFLTFTAFVASATLDVLVSLRTYEGPRIFQKSNHAYTCTHISFVQLCLRGAFYLDAAVICHERFQASIHSLVFSFLDIFPKSKHIVFLKLAVIVCSLYPY